MHEEQLDHRDLLRFAKNLPQNAFVAFGIDRFRLVIYRILHHHKVRLFGENISPNPHGAINGVGSTDSGIHKIHLGVGEGFRKPRGDSADVAVCGILGLPPSGCDRAADCRNGYRFATPGFGQNRL